MSQARLLFSEAWSSIRMNLSTTFAATMTVLIGMCLLGLFIALGTWVLSWSNHIQKELQVQVYACTTASMADCKTNATTAQELAVGRALRNDPHVQRVTFVPKAVAWAEEKKNNAGGFPAGTYDLVTGNPLPDKWVVTPTQAKYTPVIGKQICRAHYSGVEACATASTGGLGNAGGVHWQSNVTKRVLTIAKVISLVFLIAVVLLVVAATLLIANTIRLSIFARRREIEVMKLVGATNWFIRGPFMLEGLLCGLVGSLLAVILLLLGKTVALPSILPHIGGGSSTNDVHALDFTFNALALLVAGLLLGALGSGLTLRRFLQV
ncbi:MAG TPA: permease-like cell division protein FtsX [Gaiellaceae bacterium]|nr:permease-like cell division protein FtsX [Gaiellaceae bacterium]